MDKKKSYLMAVIAGVALTFSFTVQAEKKIEKTSYEQLVALSSTDLINRSKTVGEFVRVFKPHMKANEYHSFKKLLVSKNISMKAKLPKVKAKDNKIFVADGGGVIEIKSDQAFVINGHAFKGSQESAAARFETIYNKISQKKKSKVSILNVIVPEAHAFGDLMGIVSIFGAGLGGYYLGPKLGLKNSTGAILGVGGLYLATELWQSFKDGDVTCTRDGKYQQRKKGRNMWFMAKSELTTIDSAKVREAGLSENCTRNNAEALKAWAERDPLQTPVPAPDAPKSSSAIYGE